MDELEKLCLRLDSLLDELVSNSDQKSWQERAEFIRDRVDPTNLDEFLSWFEGE